MKSISPAELQHLLLNNEDLVLIDLRESWERDAFNIGGLHIPLGDIIARKEEITKEKPAIVYCEKGIRSGIVIQRLEQLGFQNLINLSGGMKAWKADLL